jgi:uncharacterized protein (DUF488 family)
MTRRTGPDLTVGVYGHSEESFYAALTAAQVDLLCDLRRRRGVRGRDYAFANAKRLAAGLADRDIGYVHFLELAPSAELRSRQHAADAASGVGKRSRSALSPAFVEGYENEVLANLDPAPVVDTLKGARLPALLCVESDPDACHRALAAEFLAGQLGVGIRHLHR